MLLVPPMDFENATRLTTPNQPQHHWEHWNMWDCRFNLVDLLQDLSFSDLDRLGNSLYLYRLVLRIIRVHISSSLYSDWGTWQRQTRNCRILCGWPDTFETKNAMFPWILCRPSSCRWRLGPPKKGLSARSQDYGL